MATQCDVSFSVENKEQTLEKYLRAVRYNGYALKFIEEQTPELCLEAVRHMVQLFSTLNNKLQSYV